MDVLSLEQEVGAWDSVLLDPLTEDSFIANLHQRFKRDHIYTYIGNVLVSVNPYKKLAIYSAELARVYRTRGPFQLPPHIYAVAGSAFRWLRDRNEDQCVVVSGESGSGKTEAAKMVLHFVSSSSPLSSKDVAVIKERLVQSGPLLEAFGNAKTYRNDNSSRFGKYFDIEFDHKGDPVGGTITNYLLEKSRVTTQAQGERNFHIFYQLLIGADIQLLKSLKLQRNIDNYAFLRSSRSLHLENIDDKRDFVTTRKAMELLGFTQEEIVNILRIVACVLKLGNIGFVPTNNIDGTEGCTISNDYELYEVCQLLGTDMDRMNAGLTQRSVSVPSQGTSASRPASPLAFRRNPVIARELYEVCDLLGTEPSSLQTAVTSRSLLDDGLEPPLVTELSASEATQSRDVLCRALYSRLFTWIVNRINESIKVKRYGKRKVLGILDIYGFEMLERNGFEQFIINFCNEKLHQVITEITLKEEQEEYVRESIDWCPVEFFNNSPVCDLIEKNNHGILSILDEESLKTSESSDEHFLARISAIGSGHCCSTPDRRSRHYITTPGSTDNSLPSNCFRLRHFAGTVTYNVSGFVEKNRDVLHRDLSLAMYKCEHSLLKSLFPEGNPKRPCVRRPATTGTQFKVALSGLLRNVSAKTAHYVRCIKPNELKQPRIFEMALVQHQVRYLGLLETVRVRRCGFCHRLGYTQFLARYKMLSLQTWPSWEGAPVEGVSYLIRDLPIPSGEFAFGRTKLFIRSPRSVYELEEFRRERLEDLATQLQKMWRGYRQRKDFLRKKRSQIIIAAAWRSWRELRFGIPFQGRRHLWCLYRVAREEYRVLKRRKQVEWAVRVIQRHFIRWKRRQFLLRLAQELPTDCDSPISRDWPPCHRRLAETSLLLRRLHHKWRCHKYRLRFDQTARNRMREKVTASIIFKERKASYPRSVSHPFLGDYVRLRQNVQWKKICVENNDQYVVFADIINKITRSSGKFVPILFVLSTSSMLILDQRTLQIKYRVPATEIYRLSLSPYLDDVAVFHVRASELSKKKGDFVFQTGHVIEIVTKLFLVVQNAVGKPPQVNISTDFEANFGQQMVTITFKCTGLPEVQPGQIRILRKGTKMEILV
ncbi:unconventional myosin-Ia isoform X3 [Nilaparvata lugens]|uniref:unconventional myosin-Ia isoform X3 n=1 Tax=Nilaparvata lugens TaxID=108931 RepID=UPI00193D441A|nr:unconventional myosin-Ia isoform X3 [Nilaparvata lugens]